MDDFASSSSRFHHHDYYNNNTRIRDFDDDEQQPQRQQQQDQDQMEQESSTNNNNNCCAFVEKEHMFDKVVTPSDVGKLNRLVIPKQHAEKYFPLDSSSNEKGLLLNFEDRCGKQWRFRYSYWTSSQSYVMTKGWSRFVKDKRLDAGDIVSFQRPLHHPNQDHFFIDWRRRPPHPSVDIPFHFHHHNVGGVGTGQFPHHHHHFQLHGQWNNNPVATPLSLQRDHVLHLPQFNNNNNVSLFHNTSYNHHHHNRYLDGSYGGASVFYHLRSPTAPPQIEAVPVVADGNGGGGSGIGRMPPATPKTTLRLFGVNMECAVSDDECDVATTSTATTRLSSSSSSQFHVYNGMPMPMMMPMTMQMPTNNNNISTMEFFEKGKSSMSSSPSFNFGT